MIKTIDCNTKEWFDSINGNSYFSEVITLNYGMKTEKTIKIHFEYGYGDYYIDRAKQELLKLGLIECDKKDALWRYCQENNIILKTSKQTNCLKRDVINFTK